MYGPNPTAISRSDVERQGLEQLTRRHNTAQQSALRAHIVLAAADRLSNARIARQEGVHVDTVRHWRLRWLISAQRCCSTR